MLLLTGTNNNGFERFEPRRKDSHTICPSGRFHALTVLPSDESVMTSERIERNIQEYFINISRPAPSLLNAKREKYMYIFKANEIQKGKKGQLRMIMFVLCNRVK